MAARVAAAVASFCGGCGWSIASAVAASVAGSEMRVGAAVAGGRLHQLWCVPSCSRQLKGGVVGMSFGTGGFSFGVAAAAALWWLAGCGVS